MSSFPPSVDKMALGGSSPASHLHFLTIPSFFFFYLFFCLFLLSRRAERERILDRIQCRNWCSLCKDVCAEWFGLMLSNAATSHWVAPVVCKRACRLQNAETLKISDCSFAGAIWPISHHALYGKWRQVAVPPFLFFSPKFPPVIWTSPIKSLHIYNCFLLSLKRE